MDAVGAGVGVADCITPTAVAVGVSVSVAVGVLVGVFVDVGVSVGVEVSVGVGVKVPDGVGVSVGIGFAIPVNTAKNILPQLIARGRASHPWLGISGADITPAVARTLNISAKEGVIISQVAPGGPAARAGLRGSQRRARVGNYMIGVGGDIIMALDGEKILDAKSKAGMWTPAKLNDGKLTKYGFGWFIDAVEGHKNIGHSGSTSGFSASIQRFPDARAQSSIPWANCLIRQSYPRRARRC